MYVNNQSLYACSVSFEPHDKLMQRQGKGMKLPPNSPFAGKLAFFGAEPLGPGKVRFSMNAPGARSVQVAGMVGTTMYDRGIIDLQPDEEGELWSAVVEGLTPGFQYIEFYVNGQVTLNPKAPFGHGYGKVVNFVEVPSDEQETSVYELRDLPHGTVHQELYHSKATGLWRTCYVYTPPCYETEPERRFPVLYLQHGGGEDETCWLWQGKINLIQDNLLAENACEPCIIVMNAGYAFRADEPYLFLPGNFGKMLHDDCIPLIDAKYRTIPDRDHRAMAGLSMGSYQTTKTITDYPDMIGWAGLLSGGLVRADMEKYGVMPGDPSFGDSIFDQPEKLAKMNMVFVATGDQERSRGNLQMAAEMKDICRFETYITPGVHEWRVWRNSARRLLTLLWK